MSKIFLRGCVLLSWYYLLYKLISFAPTHIITCLKLSFPFVQDKAESELKKLRQSLCFKARPLPEFYRERKPPKNQIQKVRHYGVLFSGLVKICCCNKYCDLTINEAVIFSSSLTDPIDTIAVTNSRKKAKTTQHGTGHNLYAFSISCKQPEACPAKKEQSKPNTFSHFTSWYDYAWECIAKHSVLISKNKRCCNQIGPEQYSVMITAAKILELLAEVWIKMK